MDWSSGDQVVAPAASAPVTPAAATWGASDAVVAPAPVASTNPAADPGVPTVQTGSSVQNGIPTASYSPAANQDNSQSTAARLPGILGDINDIGNNLGDAFVHNVVKPVVGVGQLAAHGIQSLTNSGAQNAAPGSVGANIAGYVNGKVGQLDNTIQNNEQQYQASVPNNAASYTGAAIGQVLPWLFGGGEASAAIKAPEAVSLGTKVLNGAVQGGLIGASQPVTNAGTDPQDYAQEKLKQAGLGMATGGAIPVAASIPGAVAQGIVGQVDPVAQALAKKAAGYGIDITAPQLSTSTPMKIADSVTGQFPFSGARSFAAKQQGQFNNAVAQTIGLPDGTTKITPDVFNQAYSKASQGFNDLWSRNNLPVSPQLLSNTVQIANDATNYGAADNAGQALNGTINRIVDLANQNGGQVPGRAFQSIDSDLGRVAMQGGQQGYYAGQMQDALRDGMQQSMSPSDASQLNDLRGTWQNIKQLTPIVAKQLDGNIPPNALMGAVTSNGAAKNAMAQGTRGDLGDLAQIGKRFLGNTYQDSGTAARVAGMDTLKTMGAVAAGAPTGTLAPLAGAGLAARGVQQVLRSRGLYNALANQSATSGAPVVQNALSRYLTPIAADQAATQPLQMNALSAPQYIGVQ